MARFTDRQRKNRAARAMIEDALAGVYYREFSTLWRQLYPRLRRLDGQRPVTKSAKSHRLTKQSFIGGDQLWEFFKKRLRAKLTAALQDGTVSLAQVHNAWSQSQAGVGYEPLEIDPAQLVESLQGQIGEHIDQITDETRRKVARRVADWYNTPEKTLGDLVDELSPYFGEKRAHAAATTETTWLNSEVTRDRMDKLGIEEWWWDTARDEITCRKCREKHGKVFKRGDPMPPRASHPHCRCEPVEIVNPNAVTANLKKPDWKMPEPPQPTPAAPVPTEDQMDALSGQKWNAGQPVLLSNEDAKALMNKPQDVLNADELEQLVSYAQHKQATDINQAGAWSTYVKEYQDKLTAINQAQAAAMAAPAPVIQPAPQAAVAAPATPVPTPASLPKQIGVKHYVAMKQKALSGLPLTVDELDAAEAFAAKTWKGKPAPVWISSAKAATQQATAQVAAVPVPPLTVKSYIALSQKATKQILTGPELQAVKDFSAKTWGKVPAWVGDQETGKLKPETVKVAKQTGSSISSKNPPGPKPFKPASPPPAPVPPPPPPPPPPQDPMTAMKTAWASSKPLDHKVLLDINLHDAEPTWKIPKGAPKTKYGGIIFDDQGRVLLRKPTGGYGGYLWTFAKGTPDYADEHGVDVAVREVEQETGHSGQIVGLVPGSFQSTYSNTYFFVMHSTGHDPAKMDKETEAVEWFTPDEAIKALSQSPDAGNVKRDLQIFQAAKAEHDKISAGKSDYSHLLAGYKPPAPVAPPKPKKTAPAIKPRDLFAPQAGFPSSVGDLTHVRPLGGSTGAVLMKDAKGNQFVVKHGNHAAHLMEEAHADAVYQAAGINVPRFQVYQGPAGPIKVSEFVSGDTLKDVLNSGDAKRIHKAKKNLQSGFAADALLGNWDVIGMDADNVLVDKKGQVWRIDNGGSMRMRAQGQPKGDAWNPYPTELWTMRGKEKQPGDPAVQGANAQAAGVYGDMTYADVCKSVRELTNNRDAIIAATPVDTRDTMIARLDNLEHVAEAGEQMTAHGWRDGYQDGFGRQVMETRKAGITDKLPAKLSTKKSGNQYDVSLKDEHGKAFDSLRGPKSIVADVKKRIEQAGGDYDIIKEWMSNQASNSWRDEPQAFKWYIANELGLTDKCFWKDGKDYARDQYDNQVSIYGKEKYDRTVQMYHAFTYEFLSTADLPNKNSDGTFTLIRTESSKVVSKHKVGDTNIVGKRGALESTSLLNAISVSHSHVTVQRVPISNILGTYLVERYPGYNHGAFLGDSENEFVAVLGDQPFDYVASTPYGYKY